MKKILYIVLPVLLLAACTKDISRFNEETKKPATVPAGSLFSNAVKTLADGLVNASVNVNVFRFTVKHWAMAVYQDEAQYNFTTRAIPQAWWTQNVPRCFNRSEQKGEDHCRRCPVGPRSKRKSTGHY